MEKNYLSYEDFGAVGDGITDDFAAIIATHEEANRTNTPVKAKDGAKYYIGGKDASANIMSNFAKMFAHDDAEEEKTSSITEVGNSAKTLEDFVVDAVRKAIGSEISAKWNNGADFNRYAEAEIKRQVELWMSNNISELVEMLIKKEVERVIAKVGS